MLDAHLALLQARAKFVTMALRDELPLFRRAPSQQVFDALAAAGFPPHLGGAAASAGDGDGGGGGGGEGGGELGASGRAYDYLLRMPLLSLTAERVVKLEDELERKRAQVHELTHTSELSLWKRELQALRAPLQAHLEAAEASLGAAKGEKGLTRRAKQRKAAA